MRRDDSNGAWWALGLVGAAAVAGMARGARGSRAEQLRRGRAKADVGAMWKLASEKIYGTSQRLPFIATREALQNSRDAILDAIEAGQIRAGEGRFDVRWDEASKQIEWEDNGIGMSSDTVFDVFLNLGKSKGKGAQKSERAGGFGLAKAVLLGCSETFRWKLHTRGSVFVSEGFDEDVVEKVAPSYKQGTILTVYDVKDGASDLNEKIKSLLASSKTDIRITFNGEPVRYAFHGTGEQVFENARWGSGVTGKVTLYRRLDDEGGIYVRLKGLTQFIESPRGLTNDVVIDLETQIPPTEPGYPFSPSRMNLDSTAWSTLYQIREELITEKASAAKKLAEHTIDEESGSIEEMNANRTIENKLLQELMDDPMVVSALEQSNVSGQVLRQALNQQRRQDRRQTSVQSSAKPATSFTKIVEATSQAAKPATQEKKQQISKQMQKSPPREQERNPLAGVAKLRINRTQWDKERLAPFLKNAKGLIPLLTLWRLTVTSLLKRRDRLPYFKVGLIFDDSVVAAYESGTSTFYVNPARVVKVIEKSPNRPDVVAALLFNSAAHETTHHVGYAYHDEDFIVNRQALGDYNVDLLPALSLMAAKLLGLKAATAPAKPKAPRLPKAQKLTVSYGEVSPEDQVKLKHQISSALEARQKIEGFVLDSYDWSADNERTYSLEVYDRPTRAPGGGDTLGSVSIGWYSLEFSPRDGETASKRWSSYDGSGMTDEPSGTPVDLAKPSVAFLLKEIKKAKKALSKRRD